MTTTTHASPDVKDSVIAHIIPRGIRRRADMPADVERGDKYVITTSVVFRPVTTTRTDAPVVDLETLPSRIRDHVLPSLSAVVAPPGGSVAACVSGAGRNVYEDRYTSLQLGATKDIVFRRIDALWKHLLAGDDGRFSGLREVLREPDKGQTQRSTLDEVARPVENGGGKVPDILTVPMAELSQLLVMERARRIMGCAVAADGRLPVRECPIGEGAYFDRPWMRSATALEEFVLSETALARAPAAGSTPDGTPVRLASTAQPEREYDPFRYGPPASDGPMAKLREALVRERKNLNHALDRDESLQRFRTATSAAAASARTITPDNASGLQGIRDLRKSALTLTQAARGASYNEELNRRMLLHAAERRDDHGSAPPLRAASDRCTVAQHRWFSLQGLPALMRLLHLVVDVDFVFDAKAFQDVICPDGAGLSDHVHDEKRPAFFFRIAPGPAQGQDGCQLPPTAVLAKLTLPPAVRRDGGGPRETTGTCWPATLEEYLETRKEQPKDAQDLRCRGTIDQFDGIFDLSAAVVDDNNQRVDRFVVDSLDVTIALESECQRQAAYACTAEARTRGDLPDSDVQAAACDRKLRSGGLRLIDQWRNSVAVKEFVRAFDETASHAALLDADDLTIGFKLDVAVRRDAGSELDWRPLTARQVTYSLHPDCPELPNGPAIDRALSALLGRNGAAAAIRADLDGATLAMPTRLQTTEKRHRTAYAEPTVAAWDGDPLGIGAADGPRNVETCDLPLGLTFGPEVPREMRPHVLRFGAAYWLGARAVLMGGIVRPLTEARRLYAEGLGDGMAYPSGVDQMRRFLRHEWIDAPMVATPWTDIRTEFQARRGLDGHSMIVRSGPREEPEDHWRFEPAVTRRVLFAPCVGRDFAHLHGVFDQLPAGQTPRGGLRGVDFVLAGSSDRDINGQVGFPAFPPDAPPDDASIRSGSRSASGGIAPLGLAVFRPARNPARESNYFPDPAARHLVIALRKTDPAGPYLAGAPIIVDLYPGLARAGGPATPGFPDARPVVLTVRRHLKAGAEPLCSYDQLRTRAGKRDLVRDLPRGGEFGVAVREVELHLAPGEALAVESWCIPDLPHLAAWFDAPEAMAFLTSATARGAGDAPALAALCEAIGAAADSAPSGAPGPMVRRGECTFPASLVGAAAKELLARWKQHPIPNLGAVRRLSAIHAVERPRRAPVFCTNLNLPKGSLVRLKRVSDPSDTGSWAFSADREGGLEVLARASVIVDRADVETVELRLQAVAPRAGAIDDPSRGRSLEDRIRGDGVKPEPVPGLSPTRHLFGFEVGKNGRVTLPHEVVTFADWRLDPPTLLVEPALDLSEPSHARRTRRDQDRFFADGTARRILAYLAATSRTARQIPERTVYPDSRQQQRDAERRFVWPTASPDGAPRTVQTVLRATVRPAAVPPKSLLPAFAWHADVTARGGARHVIRRSRIRIRIERPWFTSGEDERLGIVLWPPNILSAKPTALGQGKVPRAEPLFEAEDPKEPMALLEQNNAVSSGADKLREPYFTDEDLGPGGAFITRWAADPIHRAGQVSWFIDASAFRDVEDWSANALDSIPAEDADTGTLWPESERYTPRLVENVLMPIPEAEHLAAAESAREVNYMMVSLLTYAPLFDVESEQWYVDVEIDPGPAPDPFVRLGLVRFQPHASRRLQVSYPIAERIQIPGYARRVDVVVDETKRQATLSVVAPVQPDLEEEAPHTILRATVIERRRTASGLIVERIARRPDAEGPELEPYILESTARPVGSSLWNVVLALPARDDEEEDEVSHAVLVEECYRMRRSSFDAEPIRPADEPPGSDRTNPAFWADSGPRFAVRIEL